MAIIKGYNEKRSAGGISGGNQLVPVLVQDIILDDSHPRWAELGGWDSLGTIIYIDPKDSNATNKQRALLTARPLFPNNKYYPLKNEMVLVLSTITKDVLVDGDGRRKGTYYLPSINIWNHPHHNALPQNILIPDENDGDVKPSSFKKAEGGIIVRNKKKGDATVPYGQYFNEKINIKPLLPYEGDTIFEGRYGSSIRFGSTTPTKEADPEATQKSNLWSFKSLGQESKHTGKKGEIGDPIVIIRNGQSPPRENNIQDNKGWIPTIENINTDDSSIYMTSNQAVDIEVAGARNKNPYNQGTTDTNKSFTDADEILTIKDVAVNIYKDIEGTVNEIIAFANDPLEYLAPTQPVVTTSSIYNFDDGENDFSFFDELIASSSTTSEDFERYAIEYENEEVSGTELSFEEEQNWPAPETNQETGTPNTDSSTGGGGGGSGWDNDAREEYSTQTLALPIDSSGGAFGSQVSMPYLDTVGKINKGFQDYKDGVISYPFALKHRRGDYVTILNPVSITDMIAHLKTTNINAQNPALSKIKHLAIHTTATGYTEHYLLAKFFGWQSKVSGMRVGWTRGGYNISVAGDGTCNYNVPMIDIKTVTSGKFSVAPGQFVNSWGVGGNGFGKNTLIKGNNVLNTNTINMSWIGTYKSQDPLDGITSKETCRVNISKAQAYSYALLIEYFVEAFPNILILGHNQISIGDGSGKSCPCWDPVEYCDAIGVGENVYRKHLDQYTKEEIAKFTTSLNKKNYSNFASYRGEKYRRTAQYVAKLAGYNTRTDLL